MLMVVVCAVTGGLVNGEAPAYRSVGSTAAAAARG